MVKDYGPQKGPNAYHSTNTRWLTCNLYARCVEQRHNADAGLLAKAAEVCKISLHNDDLPEFRSQRPDADAGFLAKADKVRKGSLHSDNLPAFMYNISWLIKLTILQAPTKFQRVLMKLEFFVI